METNAKTIKDFIEFVIKHRKRLLADGTSKKNYLTMATHCRLLTDLLSCYTFTSDISMARFFYRHAQEIYDILPGKTSNLFEKKQLEFYNMEKLCLEIIAAKKPKQF